MPVREVGKITRLIDLIKHREGPIVAPIGGNPFSTFSYKNFDYSTPERVKHVLALEKELDYDFLLVGTDDSAVVEALGFPVHYSEGGTQVAEHPVTSAQDLKKINLPLNLEEGNLAECLISIELVKKHSQKIVCGSLFGPFTVAAALAGTSNLVTSIITNPQFVHDLLFVSKKICMSLVAAYEKRGVDVIWIAEPTAVMLSPRQFKDYLGQYLKEIFSAVKIMTILHVCGDTTVLTNELVATGVQGLSLDYLVDMVEMSEIVPEDIVLIGNVDPVYVSRSTGEEVRTKVTQLIKKMESVPNFIVSTGCLLPGSTPPGNVKTIVDTVRTFREVNYKDRKLLNRLRKSLINGSDSSLTEVIKSGLDEGIPPEILLDNLVMAMERAGTLFQQKHIFIPELMVIAEAMHQGLDMLKPLIKKEDTDCKGRVLIGTVQNDFHDIGKNLVVLMLETGGFEVIDLGKNVSPDDFAEAVGKYKPDLLGLSALTTVTMESMRKTIATLIDRGIRENLKIIIGGAPVFEEFAKQIGADAYAEDAPGAVETAKIIIKQNKLVEKNI